MMTRILALAPWLGLIAYQALGVACGSRLGVLQPLTLGLFLALGPIIWNRLLSPAPIRLHLSLTDGPAGCYRSAADPLVSGVLPASLELVTGACPRPNRAGRRISPHYLQQ